MPREASSNSATSDVTRDTGGSVCLPDTFLSASMTSRINRGLTRWRKALCLGILVTLAGCQGSNQVREESRRYDTGKPAVEERNPNQRPGAGTPSVGAADGRGGADNADVIGRGVTGENDPNAVTQRPLGDGSTTAASGEDGGMGAHKELLRDPSNILSKRSVYYELDSSVIRDDYKPMLEAHGKYLTDNRSARVLIQGNCDERGSREYNIGLGQRRADGIKKMLILLGAAENQLEAVSLGKEKPRATGHDEAAYSENRRSDILYQGEY